MKHILKFQLDKETKGALRYQEVSTNGEATQSQFVVGTLYIRKSQVDGKPGMVTVTVETE